ncbi:hypothetical protein BJ508DRAFT_410363 [Ascobolus immersus RN42]|uniref:F-box domain-containing protein n=1 Tax=Ascobolus immersus RN42 TaxID=1160509 RepID=A0A3N4IN82_ASCIM|nr:hypothetical protein BJ508DRAFT_410363 [Ascobolus immersus RN42]
MTSSTATLSILLSSRVAPAQQPLRLDLTASKAQPTTLSNLPFDVLLLIFESIDSFPSLVNFIRTSSIFHNVYTVARRPICYAIARNQFSAEALPVLDMARPNGLAPKVRDGILETSVSEVNSVRWSNKDLPEVLRTLVRAEFTEINELNPDPGVVGPREVKRLYEDSRLVDMRVERVWEPSCVKSLGKDHCMSPSEHRRLRAAIYNARSLVSSFLSGDDGGQYYDYTCALKFMSLEALFDVLHLCEITGQGENWILTMLTSRARLHRITADRLGETIKVREKVLKLGLQDVQRTAIWDEGQEKVLQLIELAKQENIGYPGGYNASNYTIDFAEATNSKKQIMEIPILLRDNWTDEERWKSWPTVGAIF